MPTLLGLMLLTPPGAPETLSFVCHMSGPLLSGKVCEGDFTEKAFELGTQKLF